MGQWLGTRVMGLVVTKAADWVGLLEVGQNLVDLPVRCGSLKAQGKEVVEFWFCFEKVLVATISKAAQGKGKLGNKLNISLMI